MFTLFVSLDNVLVSFLLSEWNSLGNYFTSRSFGLSVVVVPMHALLVIEFGPLVRQVRVQVNREASYSPHSQKQRKRKKRRKKIHVT